MTIRAIDLFAGAGGTSTGARMAGVNVVCALNHWPVAVATHAINHPETAHVCQDIATVDPSSMPEHDVMLASPSCVGHTRARGKEQSHHDACRATADDVLRFAEANRPRAVIVENVPEMMQWRRYRSWRMGWSDLGYRVSEQVIDAADAGVPQNRRRLFVVASRTVRPIAIPQPTARHVTARECIDLDAGAWSPWAMWCEKTRVRCVSGRARFGDVFLVAYYGSVEGGRSIDRPIGTLTTVDRYAVVRGDVARMLSVEEMARLSSFPADYVLTGTKRDRVKMLGNSVPPMLAAHVIGSVVRAL
jgi:DNA (cytosine-5)-methyltransferase 1